MDIQLTNSVLHLPSLDMFLITIGVIYLIIRWSKQADTSKLRLFFFFFISTLLTPLYTEYTIDGKFLLWFPLGFILVILFPLTEKKVQSVKMKASVLGLFVGVYYFLVHSI